MLISILVITREREGSLIKLLETISNQKLNEDIDLEIIILYNGSEKDINYKILEEFRKKFNIKIYFSKKNLGVAGGRNYLAKIAKGEWLFFIDDDAFIPEREFIMKAYKIITQSLPSNAAIIGCNVIDYYKPWENFYPFPKRDLAKIKEKITMCSYFVGTAHLIRKIVFTEVGGYDDHLFFWGEELDLSYRIIDRGYEIYFCKDLLVIHKRSDFRIINKRERDKLFLRNKIYLNYKFLPLRYMIISNIVWILYYLFKKRDIFLIFYAIFDSVKISKKIFRKKLSNDAINYLRKNYGRLLF